MGILEKKVALVTGAGSGIGREVALAYAREGAAVIVSDIDEKGGRETCERIAAAQGRTSFFRADVAQPAECEALAGEAVRVFGGLDIACNNAGIGGKNYPLAELPIEEWNRVLTINLSGVFYCMRAQIPRMLARGGGAIVNIASVAGMVGFRNSGAYVPSKHGVVGITKTAALDYAANGIRVNAIGPGVIQTPLLDATFDAATQAALAALHPLGRLGRTEEVAELAVWISSPRASFVTGAYFPVDSSSAKGFDGYGHYHETYEKVGAEWKIKTVRHTRLLLDFHLA